MLLPLFSFFPLLKLHIHLLNNHILKIIGEGNGNPLQYSCLENPMDGRTWWAAICGVAQSWTQLKRLSSSNSSILKIYFPEPWVHILCLTLFFLVLCVNLFFCLFVLNQFYCFSCWKIVYLLSWLYKSCIEKFFFLIIEKCLLTDSRTTMRLEWCRFDHK